MQVGCATGVRVGVLVANREAPDECVVCPAPGPPRPASAPLTPIPITHTARTTAQPIPACFRREAALYRRHSPPPWPDRAPAVGFGQAGMALARVLSAGSPAPPSAAAMRRAAPADTMSARYCRPSRSTNVIVRQTRARGWTRTSAIWLRVTEKWAGPGEPVEGCRLTWAAETLSRPCRQDAWIVSRCALAIPHTPSMDRMTTYGRAPHSTPRAGTLQCGSLIVPSRRHDSPQARFRA